MGGFLRAYDFGLHPLNFQQSIQFSKIIHRNMEYGIIHILNPYSNLAYPSLLGLILRGYASNPLGATMLEDIPCVPILKKLQGTDLELCPGMTLSPPDVEPSAFHLQAKVAK